MLRNLLSSLTFDSVRVYCNSFSKISFGIDCEQSLFCSKSTESALDNVSVGAVKPEAASYADSHYRARERLLAVYLLQDVRKSLLWLSTVQFEHFAGLGVSPQGFSALIQADSSPLQQFT